MRSSRPLKENRRTLFAAAKEAPLANLLRVLKNERLFLVLPKSLLWRSPSRKANVGIRTAPSFPPFAFFACCFERTQSRNIPARSF